VRLRNEGGRVFMAVQQNKAVGMVANTMTITKLVNQSKTAGQPMKMIDALSGRAPPYSSAPGCQLGSR
jgi:hypothetical protein